MTGISLRTLMCGVFLMAWVALAHAAPDDATAQSDYAALANLLEDERSRERLIAELRALAAGESPADGEAAEAPTAESISLARRIALLTQGFAEDAAANFDAVMGLWSGLDIATAQANLESFAVMAGDLLLVIAVTVVAFLVIRRLARGLFQALDRWAGAREGFLRRALAVVGASLVDALVILAAWVAGYLLALFVLGEDGRMDTRQSLFLNAFLLIEGAKLLLRALFAPRNGGLRLLPLQDEDATYWNLWLARLTGFVGYGMLLVVPIINVNLSFGIGRAMTLLIMTAAFLQALIIVLQNRADVRRKLEAFARDIELGATRFLVFMLARSWHLLALLYVAALSVVTISAPETALPFMAKASLQTVVAIGGGVVISLLLTQVIVRQIRVPEETRRRLPQLEARLNTFVPLALKIMRVVVLALVALAICDAWNLFNLREWLGSDNGLRTLGSLTSVVVILAVAGGIWIALASVIEYRLNPETGDGEPTARVRTLLSIFRNAVAIVLIILTGMIVLSEIGIDIGPLLAGAGVLGLAIGFGAQKLVQDIITGVFIQLENAINTGDVVSAGGVTGTAEKLTVRSLGVRDLAGAYHIIPFSSVDSVTNYMREFAYHVGEYGVGYHEDTDEVIVQLRAAFEELAADEDNGSKLLGPLEVHGVTALADSSVNVRVRIKTIPGAQWAIGREYNRLVKRHLDAAGIEIPFPHMTVYFGEDKQGRAPAANLRLVDSGGNASGAAALTANQEGARANPERRGDFDDEA